MYLHIYIYLMYTYIVAGLSLLTTNSVHRDDPSSRITSRRPPRRRVAARRVAAVQMGKYQTRCMENIPRLHQSGKCFPWKIYMKIRMVSLLTDDVASWCNLGWEMPGFFEYISRHSVMKPHVGKPSLFEVRLASFPSQGTPPFLLCKKREKRHLIPQELILDSVLSQVIYPPVNIQKAIENCHL